MPGELAHNFYRQMVLAAQIDKLPFDHRVELFEYEHFIEPLQEGEGQSFRKDGESQL